MGEFKEQEEALKNGVEAARARIENARMTRRQALRKFGFTAGMAAFAMVSVDDLARLASKKMQENEATKGIGDTLAKEFRAAGVALADPDPGNPYGGYNAQDIDCIERCDTAKETRDNVCFQMNPGHNRDVCLSQSKMAQMDCYKKCK